jgi:ribosomal protein L29
MKRKELTTLRGKTKEELMKIVIAKKLEADKTKMKIIGGKEKNVKVGRNLSREIAKILTLVREKEIIESLTVVEPEVEEKKTKGVEVVKGKKEVKK